MEKAMNMRVAFGKLNEIENLEPEQMTVTPAARTMPCPQCQTETRHEQTKDGAWVCWCGRDETAAIVADERAMSLINATARMFGEMRVVDRVGWIALLVKCLCCIPGAKKAIVDAVGRNEF